VHALVLVHAAAVAVASLLFASLLRRPAPPVVPAWRRRLVVAGGLLVGPVALSALAVVWAVPGGLPALVGTRRGRLVLVQATLLAIALVVFVIMVRHTARPSRRGRTWWLAIETGLGLGMTVVAAVLAALPSRAPEPIVWPFNVRLAPAVTWSVASVRARVIVGVEILVVGLLILLLAGRLRDWRPLLLAAGVGLSALGVYRALSPMTIDAYPTTYARAPIAATGDSIRRGRDLFAAHCAACHGVAGRGDGPAAAGLLQQPADLSAAHTADHTPGDIFWWVTHGLGLAMPAFGDRLSVEDRWHLVNFVRTLSVQSPGPPAAGQPRGG
jgi:putative copper resistance protein D